jgi:MFS transporter, OPA family, sugar phosphate sensor protein UhpC
MTYPHMLLKIEPHIEESILNLLTWFRTGPDREPIPPVTPSLSVAYRRKQWTIFLSLLFGYAFFYTTRLSLSVAKKPMLDAEIVTLEELGLMGSALYFLYAFGKLTNGFLADHANIRKLMSFGLLISALINIAVGCSNLAVTFITLWGLNGWFQSMGSAPSCVSIFQWFSPRQRGRFYGAWAGSHNIGEGITFILTANVVALWGWRAGFIAPGVLCVLIAAILFFTLSDRPQVEGLPPPDVVFDEPSELGSRRPTLRAQLSVLKIPVVWQLGLASALMYVSRYAINSWGIIYLQEAKGYGAVEAGMVIGVYPMLGLLGAIGSGALSDLFFRSDRHLPTLLYGVCNVGGMALLFYGPSGVWDYVALGIFGFGIGGLIVFLAGLTAAELCPKDTVGAVKGMIGLFSYIGASLQEYISGLLITTTEVGGEKVYDFSSAISFWVWAGVLSIIVALSVKWTSRAMPSPSSA